MFYSNIIDSGKRILIFATLITTKNRLNNISANAICRIDRDRLRRVKQRMSRSTRSPSDEQIEFVETI